MSKKIRKELVLKIDDLLINIDWDEVYVSSEGMFDNDFSATIHALLLDVRDELRKGEKVKGRAPWTA
jgi:hypothetical protein